MGNFTVLGGDLGEKHRGEVKGKTITIYTAAFESEKFHLKDDVERVELQSEEDIKKLTLTRIALLGIFALGAKKDKSKFYFAVYLKDGRKFLAVTDRKTWTEIQAATF